MKIPLYKAGQVVAHAVVDDADADRIIGKRWRPHSCGYAARAEHLPFSVPLESRRPAMTRSAA